MPPDELDTYDTNRREGRSSNEPESPRVIASDELLQGRREIWIDHRGQMYRLRVTGNGKLYLSK